ncbi:MAG: TIGR00266 family protein [Chloroflexi bacterium]|nr:TIGR00266 family protein [Chloroflexota bacterium]
MQYKIFGDKLPAVSLRMNAGESIYTQSGGMSWMTDNFRMETNVKGGLMKGIGRVFSGESLFMATYTATAANAEITLASSFPGEIRVLELDGSKTYIAQKSAFLCATPGVELSTVFTKRFGAGLFGGEGFVLQKFAGNGLVFVELDGSVIERELAPGERLKVDTGNIAMFEESVDYDIETVKGFTNILFGGEGLFLAVLTGPGKVWLQTVNASSFASRLIPYLPHKG